jgi:hypothetical protein
LILPLQMVFVADRYVLFRRSRSRLALAYGLFAPHSPATRARRALHSRTVLRRAAMLDATL